MKEVTVITPTIGTKYLRSAIESVEHQGDNVHHYIVADGVSLDLYLTSRQTLITLPFNTGKKELGHAIYRSIVQLVQTPHVVFLDEDNYFRPNHIETMLQALKDNGGNYATCRREVITKEGQHLCFDNFESIGWNGKYPLYDTNTFLFKTEFIRKHIHTMQGAHGADITLTNAICQYNHVHLDDHYGVVYRSPERNYQFFKNQTI